MGRRLIIRPHGPDIFCTSGSDIDDGAGGLAIGIDIRLRRRWRREIAYRCLASLLLWALRFVGRLRAQGLGGGDC